MSVWTWAWIGWGIAFLALEIPAAVFTKGRGTLSWTIWRWVTHPFDAKGKTAAAWAGRAVLLAFLAWLAGHLAFGLWSP